MSVLIDFIEPVEGEAATLSEAQVGTSGKNRTTFEQMMQLDINFQEELIN